MEVADNLKLLIGVGLKNKTEYVDDCDTFYEQGTMLTYIGRTQNWPLSAGGLIIYLGVLHTVSRLLLMGKT